MNKIKLLAFATIIFLLVSSCSLINRLKEKIDSAKEDKKENVKTYGDEKEKTISSGENDLKFYNAYIEVVNKIQSSTEELQKNYLSEVPDPKTLKKNSFVMVVSASLQLNMLESTIKMYKRSFYDNGDLSKLQADNPDMKKEIEEDFKSVLSDLEEYDNTASKVINYYQNKDFTKDPSLASGYDEEIKSAYNKYKDAFTKLNNSVKKYKPKRTQRNPDDISNPDEKAAAVLLNTYENTLDKAENFYDKFEKFKKGDDAGPLTQAVNELEKGFETDKNKIESTTFSDKTKYMKYNFEDYFSKTVNDFIRNWRKFSDDYSGKMDAKKFNDGYNDVVRYYNYMIDSYNSSITTVNSFRVY